MGLWYRFFILLAANDIPTGGTNRSIEGIRVKHIYPYIVFTSQNIMLMPTLVELICYFYNNLSFLSFIF
jgi:hypothetical protein